jgi:hypothetical protein
MPMDEQYAQDGKQDGEKRDPQMVGRYERPRIELLGTISELTQGAGSGGTDGVSPGSNTF